MGMSTTSSAFATELFPNLALRCAIHELTPRGGFHISKRDVAAWDIDVQPDLAPLTSGASGRRGIRRPVFSGSINDVGDFSSNNHQTKRLRRAEPNFDELVGPIDAMRLLPDIHEINRRAPVDFALGVADLNVLAFCGLRVVRYRDAAAFDERVLIRFPDDDVARKIVGNREERRESDESGPPEHTRSHVHLQVEGVRATSGHRAAR